MGEYWKKYEEEEKEEKPPIFAVNIPFRQDYFTIYKSNANLIGQINKPPDLRRKIVKVYTLFESLIEAYRINTVLVQKRQEVRAMWKEAEARGDRTKCYTKNVPQVFEPLHQG